MIEISIYDETFTIYTECLDKLAVKNIFSILDKFDLDYKIMVFSINARGDFKNMYEALHKLSQDYHVFIN